MIKQPVSARGNLLTTAVSANGNSLPTLRLQIMQNVSPKKNKTKTCFLLFRVMHVFDATQIATALQICLVKHNVANRHVHVGWVFSPFKALTSKRTICLDWHFPKSVKIYF